MWNFSISGSPKIDPANSEEPRFAVEDLPLGRAIIYGAAHLFDFRGVLLKRRGICSVEEAMAQAWEETGGRLGLGADIFRVGQAVGETVDPNQGHAFDETGYSSDTASAVSGVDVTQLEYWERINLVRPSLLGDRDADSLTLYSLRDIIELRLVRELIQTGASIDQVRITLSSLNQRPTGEFPSITLFSDGVKVYEGISPEAMSDLQLSSRPVYLIALDLIRQEIEDALTPSLKEPGTWSNEDVNPPLSPEERKAAETFLRGLREARMARERKEHGSK